MKLKEALLNHLSEQELKHLVGSFDVIGDIAVTIIPSELTQHEHLIGNTILEINRNIKVVAKRDGYYSGKYRTIPLTIIAGENRKETLCKEFGVKLLVNPEKVYYSIRSGNERKRISDQVTPNEQILVMFSGIGVYPLILSRHTPAAHITGIELNKDAHDYGLKNVYLNKAKNISLHHGDVREIVPLLSTTFDRIIMPLPKDSRSYIKLALQKLAKYGRLHVYEFQNKETVNHSVDYLADLCKINNRVLIDASAHICGHSSPSKYRICIDGIIA